MDAEIKVQAREQAEICAIFGNTRRILILWVLGKDEMSVTDIAANIDASLPNTSQHLRLMKDKGILISRRDGQTIYYSIARNSLTMVCKLMFQAPPIEVAKTPQ